MLMTTTSKGHTCAGLAGGCAPASSSSSSSSIMPVMLGGLLLGGADGPGGSVESVTADTTLPPATRGFRRMKTDL